MSFSANFISHLCNLMCYDGVPINEKDKYCSNICIGTIKVVTLQNIKTQQNGKTNTKHTDSVW